MKGNLTPKQRKFWKRYSETHSLTDAARYIGSNGKGTHSLSQVGYQILKQIEPSMEELLDAKGLTDEAMIEPLRGGIKAQKPIVATWEGKITDQLWIEDHPTRAKFLEMYHRLKGNFVDRHELTGKDGGDLVLMVAPATRKIEKDNKKEITFD